MSFFAHTKGLNESDWQTVKDHLTNTADLAATFGQDANIGELAWLCGYLHDLGKYSSEFQARLKGSSGKVDHATAGAQEIINLYKGTAQEPLATLLAFCISGHHTGLLDYGSPTDLPGEGTLQSRLKTKVCDYRGYKTEIDLTKIKFPEWLNIHPLKLRRTPDEPPITRLGFSLGFLTRMLYSALVDADFQETENFVQGKKSRGEFNSIQELSKKLNQYLERFNHPQSLINCNRTETLKSCVEKASNQPGFFKLTVPTGGGKTLASMAFALNHAVKNNLKHVIYVIPFTTIIDQNARVFKEILGEENVLEHHSNFDWEQKKAASPEEDQDQTRSVYSKLKLAAENWDIPVIVTTNVQFFESLFANKSSRCRKLHNLAKSVIIFDEAQMFPKEYLLPAMGAIEELVINYGASAVFCTATQPNLERFLPAETKITELAADPQELFRFYKRVNVKLLPNKLTDNDLAIQLQNHHQVLCIVNTRKHASGLFKMLCSDGKFHLSTLMCPVHRRETLDEIRMRLKNGEVCRVVSTTVMEAGVDVDFPIGYRALTGLDSINQAAGRINRNMELATADMYVFEPDSDFAQRIPKFIVQNVAVTRNILRKYASEPISIPAIHDYFEQLYALKNTGDFDYQNILNAFHINTKGQPEFNFASVAKNFHVITDLTQTVIIPYNQEVTRLLEELQSTQFPLATLRKLQPYTVSIYPFEAEALAEQGAITLVADKYAALNDLHKFYDPGIGLIIPASQGGNAFFSDDFC
jgi:CRISPR-associated endonuclease/helicase Cas3